jgi:hypothetical protein
VITTPRNPINNIGAQYVIEILEEGKGIQPLKRLTTEQRIQ